MQHRRRRRRRRSSSSSSSKHHHHDVARRREGSHRRHHRRRRSEDQEHEKDDANVVDDGGQHHHRHGSSREDSKTLLTDEEERLYARAKEFLERSRKHNDRHRRRHHRENDYGQDRPRRGSRRNEDMHDDDDDDDDDANDDESNAKRSRRHRKKENKKHKHGRSSSHRGDYDDDEEVRSRHTKKIKQSHAHTTTTTPTRDCYTGDEEFKNKAYPIDHHPSKQLLLVPLGNRLLLGDKNPTLPSSVSSLDEITKLDAQSDYFSHNVHLRLYLYRNYGIYFEDLTSSESRCAFAEFTKLYNSGMLEEAYYSNNLPQEAVDQCSRTKHKWTFRTNTLEEQSLELVRAGVRKQTEYSAAANLGTSTMTGKKLLGVPSGAAIAATITRQGNTSTTNNDHQRQQQPDYAQTVASRKQANRAHSERIKLANEEIHGVRGGKADTGWERMREKKMERTEKLHGAHRDRESDAWELNDDDIYGTAPSGAGCGGKRRGGGRGDVSFEEALAQERQYRERKEAESAARRAGLLEKEAERQKKMFDALGLSGMMKPGEKITIAPRNDTPG